MAKQRPIHVCIWDDEGFQEFTPHEKLIFIHLLTNKSITESGVYPYTFKTISNNTGIEKAEVMNTIKGSLEKTVGYDSKNAIIWVKNRLRHNKSGNPGVIFRSILNDYKAMKRSSIWESYWDYNKDHIEDMIDKSKNLKNEIAGNSVILPNRLIISSLTIGQLLANG